MFYRQTPSQPVLLCQPLLQCISNVFSFSLYVQVLAAVCVRVCVTFSCADETLWQIGCGDQGCHQSQCQCTFLLILAMYCLLPAPILFRLLCCNVDKLAIRCCVYTGCSECADTDGVPHSVGTVTPAWDHWQGGDRGSQAAGVCVCMQH